MNWPCIDSIKKGPKSDQIRSVMLKARVNARLVMYFMYVFEVDQNGQTSFFIPGYATGTNCLLETSNVKLKAVLEKR